MDEKRKWLESNGFEATPDGFRFLYLDEKKRIGGSYTLSVMEIVSTPLEYMIKCHEWFMAKVLNGEEI
jgi:hypothetical protein